MAEAQRVDLSIIVPVFNESTRIESGLPAILGYARSLPYSVEVVVFDDGSRDDTAAKARRIIGEDAAHRVLEGGVNRGKGAAIRDAMREARGEARLFTDIDLSVPIERTADFYARVRSGAPVVIGSRKMAGSRIDVRQPYYRELLGGVFRWTSRMLFAPTVTDFTCGFKAFSGPAADVIFGQARVNRWAFDTEILFLAHRMGFAIHQVPVEWSNSADSRVRVGIDAVNSLAELAGVLASAALGRYNFTLGSAVRTRPR